MKAKLALVAAALALAGCTAPSPSPTPLSAAVLAQAIEEHFGQAYALGGSDTASMQIQPTTFLEGVGAWAYYRAKPGVPAKKLELYFNRQDPGQDVDCPAVDCSIVDGVWVNRPAPQHLELISPRAEGFVFLPVTGRRVDDAELAQLRALVSDPRLGATVEAALAHAAATNPRWQPNAPLDCTGTQPLGIAPTSPTADSRTELATPQALAAIVTNHLSVSCAGDTSDSPGVAATLYLGHDNERVEVQLAAKSPDLGCGTHATCTTKDGVKIARTEAQPADNIPVSLTLVRRIDSNTWVVVEAASMKAATTKKFPIPLDTLVRLANDDRLGREVDPGLNYSGDAMLLRWRITPATVE